MGSLRRSLGVLAVMLVARTSTAPAQEPTGARAEYFEAVADFFELPSSEVVILADWDIEDDEIPAVLFVARYAGVSPEALVALRRAGRPWAELVRRYALGAQTLHVPIRDGVPAGALADAYERYRTTPVAEWPGITLSDGEVVALVNVRVIAQTLGLSAEEVVARTGSGVSYVELFAQLSR